VLKDSAYRLLDATANRAGEALRVIEDYARFILDDAHLTAEWKRLRHDLTTVLQPIPMSTRCAMRETECDVGASLSVPEERKRNNFGELARANISRLQQSLRSLEETAKLIDADLAAECESLRYRSYTVAAAMETTQDSRLRLESVHLCVLVDGCSSTDNFRSLVQSLIEAGVGAIQLRDKSANDRDLLARSRLLSELTADHRTLSLINDRADLAVLAGVDGVHVGQTDFPVRAVRRIVGADRLIGVSTHSIEQARQAVLDGANYLGVGPVFPSQTKSFESFPGPALLEQVAREISLPSFAIGGIDQQNAALVIESGFHRLAVASAVTAASDPAQAVAQLRELLEVSATSR
tara:strand:+ start:475 stop:1527 length:1053 start_codon:yes stop_codon:yes gene_type:complete